MLQDVSQSYGTLLKLYNGLLNQIYPKSKYGAQPPLSEVQALLSYHFDAVWAAEAPEEEADEEEEEDEGEEEEEREEGEGAEETQSQEEKTKVEEEEEEEVKKEDPKENVFEHEGVREETDTKEGTVDGNNKGVGDVDVDMKPLETVTAESVVLAEEKTHEPKQEETLPTPPDSATVMKTPIQPMPVNKALSIAFRTKEFIDISACLHVAALTSLIESVVDSRSFRKHMDLVMDEIQVLRRERYFNHRRRTDMRAEIKGIEEEIETFDKKIAELDGQLSPMFGGSMEDVGATPHVGGGIAESSMGSDVGEVKYDAPSNEVGEQTGGGEPTGTNPIAGEAAVSEMGDIASVDVRSREGCQEVFKEGTPGLDDGTGGTLGSTSNVAGRRALNRLIMIEAGKAKREADKEKKLEILRTTKERNKLVDRIEAIEKDIEKMEESDQVVRGLMIERMTKVRLTSVRIIGLDREGSIYTWVDVTQSGKTESMIDLDDDAVLTIPGTGKRGRKRKSEKGGGALPIVPIEIDDEETLAKRTQLEHVRANARNRVCGILIQRPLYDFMQNVQLSDKVADNATNADQPADTEGSQAPFTLPSRPSFRYIDSFFQLKDLIRNLNHRGHRERDLMVNFRERLKRFGVIIPHPNSLHMRKFWDTSDNGEGHEEDLESSMQKFGVWLRGLGKPLDSSKCEISSVLVAETNAGEVKEKVEMDVDEVGSAAPATMEKSITEVKNEKRDADGDVEMAMAAESKATEESAIAQSSAEYEKLMMAGALDRLNELDDLSKNPKPNSSKMVINDSPPDIGSGCFTKSWVVEKACLYIKRKFTKKLSDKVEQRLEEFTASWSCLTLALADLLYAAQQGVEIIEKWIEAGEEGELNLIEVEEESSDDEGYAPRKRGRKPARAERDEEWIASVALQLNLPMLNERMKAVDDGLSSVKTLADDTGAAAVGAEGVEGGADAAESEEEEPEFEEEVDELEDDNSDGEYDAPLKMLSPSKGSKSTTKLRSGKSVSTVSLDSIDDTPPPPKSTIKKSSKGGSSKGITSSSGSSKKSSTKKVSLKLAVLVKFFSA
jgi:hypothetical protein